MRSEDLHVLSVGKAIKILPRDLISQHLQLPDPVKPVLMHSLRDEIRRLGLYLRYTSSYHLQIFKYNVYSPSDFTRFLISCFSSNKILSLKTPDVSIYISKAWSSALKFFQFLRCIALQMKQAGRLCVFSLPGTSCC